MITTQEVLLCDKSGRHAGGVKEYKVIYPDDVEWVVHLCQVHQTSMDNWRAQEIGRAKPGPRQIRRPFVKVDPYMLRRGERG